jgi:hypothetical protein
MRNNQKITLKKLSQDNHISKISLDFSIDRKKKMEYYKYVIQFTNEIR